MSTIGKWICILGLSIVLSQGQRMLGSDVDDVAALLDLVLDADETTARRCLGVLTTQIQTGAVDVDRVARLRAALGERLAPILQDGEHPLRFDAAMLAASWKDAEGLEVVRRRYLTADAPVEQRLAALRTLVAAGDARDLLQAVSDTINSDQAGQTFRIGVIEGLAAVRDEAVGPLIADMLVDNLGEWEPDVRPKAIEILTQRPAWTAPLLAAVQAKQIDKDVLNLNQLRRIATFKDEGIQRSLQELYGEIREGRDPNREQVFYKTRDFLNGTPGHPLNGEAVFKKVCGQCHKLYGEGAEVGPDITRNGRNNWDQLLWNVLDPSQVIGPGYQARILVTSDGRTLTGLPVEESDQRVVLKVQGGKQETIPRDQIEVYKVSELSMMPDQLEKQLTPQELADLLSFLAHDRHPRDPEAKLLPGAPAPQR
jgi:putative heme-binding domain-containing protein